MTTPFFIPTIPWTLRFSRKWRLSGSAASGRTAVAPGMTAVNAKRMGQFDIAARKT
jgi:hypothetical protein